MQITALTRAYDCGLLRIWWSAPHPALQPQDHAPERFVGFRLGFLQEAQESLRIFEESSIDARAFPGQHADRGRTVALGGDLRDPRIAVEKHQQRWPRSESGGHVQSSHIELFTPSRRSLFRQAGVRARLLHPRRGILRLLGEKHRERKKHHAPHTISLSSPTHQSDRSGPPQTAIWEA
jgi:hypothetical protein